jgi:CheY-specific phosphatase CheX
MSKTFEILLHEPNEDFDKILGKALSNLPIKTQAQHVRKEAEFFKKLSEAKWDVVVLDHKTSHPKGDRFLDHLQTHSEFPLLKKILVTSIHLNEAGKPTEIGEIPLTFISKPFRPEILEATLMAILGLQAPAKDEKWKLDVRLLNPFVEAFVESCEETSKISLIRKTVDLKKDSDFCDLSVTTIFDKGDLFGSFTIAFPAKTFLEYSKKATKQEDRQVHQRNLHVAEEFLRKTAAKVREALEARKLRLQFRAPVVTIGKKHQAPVIQGLQPLVIHFVSDEGLPLHLELGLQKNA